MQPATEQDSLYSDLENWPTARLLAAINAEDRKVAEVVALCLPQITALVEAVLPRMQAGGRVFYIGSGTSGRLGVIDASEIPPTYGAPHGLFVGIIAGGDGAIRKAVEFAEDDPEQGWKDLQAHNAAPPDVLIGLSASGKTPYVLNALRAAGHAGLLTAAVSCNANAPLSAAAHYGIEAVVGPEFITGSTRMKAGTAQKLILNMISTALMVRLGRVKGNKMVDMQLTNAKLIDRGTRMVMAETGLEYETAKTLLLQHGSARLAISHFENDL